MKQDSLTKATDEDLDGQKKRAMNDQLENESDDLWASGNQMTNGRPKNAGNQPIPCYRKHLKKN